MDMLMRINLTGGDVWVTGPYSTAAGGLLWTGKAIVVLAGGGICRTGEGAGREDGCS